MHTTKSLNNNNNNKSYCIWIQKKKISKICISMHFGFNNQFIKVARIRPIFEKFQNKNYFVFF
jgi:hypothetical protein